ncbi:3'-5' RNA exonuclease complex component [Coemansia erecta]|uniref:3'-5' RNA exonuclease complex component n=1 Tax=Coemansia erecta TaxID=147472 RepID=A0A9W7XWL5_9FUNG|nr:3'-5' RNA exonuclease complex component [Coemansia erecta]
MQARLCSKGIRPSWLSTGLHARRPTARIRSYSSNSTGKDDNKYPSLDDILGSPATTFSQLITQLETLIKHPNPPRNYADALAKDEQRRTDFRDLTPEITPDEMSEKRKAPLRQRPRLLRNGQRVVEQVSGGPPEDPDDRPLSEATAASLGISAEQQERRRIWMSKIKGYTAFRQNLVSMDTLVNSMDAQDAAEADADAERDVMLEKGRESISQAQAQMDREDREFEQLIRRSWRIYDEDLADLDRARASKAPGGKAPGDKAPGSTPGGRAPDGSHSLHTRAAAGARQMHTSARVSAAAPGDADDKPQFTRRNIKVAKRGPHKTTYERRVAQSREVREVPAARTVGRSMIRAASVPSRAQVRKHVILAQDDVEIPIGATVHTGDLVEIRVDSEIAASSQFSVPLHLGGVVQKVTGRFHFNVVNGTGVLAGARERRVGFVAAGALFDRALLESSGVAAADAERVAAHGLRVREHVAAHGAEGLANAADAQLLYETNRAALLAQAAVRSAAGGVNRPPALDVEASDDLAVLQAPARPGAPAEPAAPAPAAGGGSEEEPVALVMLRVFPRVLRLLHQRADQLRRAHFQELGAHWALASAHGARHVTVDGLAALMFGGTGTVERLAAYMHLVGDALHYVPDGEYLFVTGRFALRPRGEVDEFERTLALARGGAPEFRAFIAKARRLVAFAHAREPSSPWHAAVDPDLAAYERTHRCALTGWRSKNAAFRRRPAAADAQPQPLLTAAEVDAVRFSETDALFIEAVRRYVLESGHEFAVYCSPYGVLAPYVLKKLRMYAGTSVSTATAFLADLGVWPHTFSPASHAPSQPFGSLAAAAGVSERRSMAEVLLGVHLHGVEHPAGPPPHAARFLPRRVPDSIAPPVAASVLTRRADAASAAGGDGAAAAQPAGQVMGKCDLYARDVCSHMRHDFGDLAVYTIDDAATRDVDDGLSVEHVRGADGATATWVHVHVADPTAVVPPGHVAAAAALQQAASMYYVERTQHMFPLAVVERLMGLAPRPDGRPTMALTFSFRLGAAGDIAEYRVRASLVRNIRAVPYDVAVRHLSFARQPAHVRSLAQLQTLERNATLIHPFAAADAQRPLYAARPADALPAQAVADLQALQQVAQRHLDWRVAEGAFTRYYGAGEVAIEPRGVRLPQQRLTRPVYASGARSPARWPRIVAGNSPVVADPAHAMVGELMIVAGRVAARFAGERGVPLLLRSQAAPDFAALGGVQAELPLALDELTAEQAQSAALVFDAIKRRARASGGLVDAKAFDEVRHMLQPTRLSTRAAPHTVMGIHDAFGYARVTSPMRRADDLVCHWQIKAQLLAEHGDAATRDATPWYWGAADLEDLASRLYLRGFLAGKIGDANTAFWRYSLIRRMESDARHGRLALPPQGFYCTDHASYEDTPWAYYDAARPGPLVWTAEVDNRDFSRPFISLKLGMLDVSCALPTRPIDPAYLPFAGTRVRVQTVSVDPITCMMIVKLAPEHLQPPETPRFWRHPIALTTFVTRHLTSDMPPAVMPAEE